MPRHTIVIDECPNCGDDSVVFLVLERDLHAGDKLDCPECGEQLRVGTYDEGWQSYYTFHI